MLPSSHTPLMIDLPAGCHGEGEAVALGAAPEIARAGMLADAFSEFIATSSRLESSYRELQKEVYGLGRELAERNAALNVSLAQNERMRMAQQQIVESMPCGVMVVDGADEISMISMMNPEAARLLGVDGGMKWPVTMREMSAESGLDLRRLFAGEDAAQEVCVQESAGKRWLEVRIRRVEGGAAKEQQPMKEQQAILILRDVTAQKLAEQDRDAGRSAMAVAEVTTTLAHEIRNPLASLELFAELIEVDAERRVEWISNLRAGIRTLAGTVNNVLSFHGSNALPMVPLPLAALVGNAIEFVQPLADQAGLLIEWWDEENDVLVNGNEAAVHQVMLNLLTNAIRHTPTGGTITVSLEVRPGEMMSGRAGDWVVLDCTDTGCGIHRDQMPRLFEPGFSGSGDTSGLGLAVCDRILRQHGGHISASNRLCSGARFRLELPALGLEMVAA